MLADIAIREAALGTVKDHYVVGDNNIWDEEEVRSCDELKFSLCHF